MGVSHTRGIAGAVRVFGGGHTVQLALGVCDVACASSVPSFLQMQAGHLQPDQKDEFCSLARSVIQQAKSAA